MNNKEKNQEIPPTPAPETPQEKKSRVARENLKKIIPEGKVAKDGKKRNSQSGKHPYFSKENPLPPEVTKKAIAASKSKRRLDGVIIDLFQDELVSREEEASPLLVQFVNNLISTAVDDPNSQAARIVAGAIGLDSSFIDRADKWLNKQQQQDEDFKAWRIVKQLHPSQQAVFAMKVPKILCIPGRRWGKTILAVAKILYIAGIQGLPCLYVHKTIKQAADTIIPAVQLMAEKTGIEIAKINHMSGQIDFSSGGSLFVRGNDKRESIDMARGMKFAFIAMDEFFFHKADPTYAIEDVLEPTMIEYPDHQLMIVSTPPPAKRAVFEKIHETWPVVTGDLGENVFIRHGKEELKRLQAERGNSNRFRREYLGSWEFDEDAIIYHPKPWDGNPDSIINPTHIICGLDYGFSDCNAFIAVAYNPVSRIAWVILEDKWNQSTTTDTIARITANHTSITAWAEERGITATIFIEADTSDKQISMDLAQNHGLPVEDALKTNRVYNIHQIDDLFRREALRIPQPGTPPIVSNLLPPASNTPGILWEECLSSVWFRDENDNLTDETDDGAFHPDGLPALRYALARVLWEMGEKRDE